MSRIAIADLLRTHSQAYKLLMHLDRRASTDPSIFGSDTVKAMSTGETCVLWLDEHRRELPPELLPREEDRLTFAEMLSSFFRVSFDVEVVELNGHVLDARIRRGRKPQPNQVRSREAYTAVAVRRALSAEGVKLTEDGVRTLVRRRELRDELHILAYVHELERRASGKSKGPVAHRLWRSLPLETRKTLDEGCVRQAMERIISVARGMLAGSTD